MADSKYFGRYYNLKIGSGESQQTFYTEPGMPAMDIKFDVTFARDQLWREGTVSILGLSWKTMHSFLELAAKPRGDAMKELMRVELKAGYFSAAGVTEIISGYAYHATISAPPQMWLTLNVSEVNPNTGVQFSGTVNGMMTIETAVCNVLDAVYNAEGVRIDFADCTQEQICNKNPKTISFTWKDKTFKDVLQELSKSLDDDIRFVLKGGVLHAYDKSHQMAPKGNIIVDKDNGLLSVTGIDAVNGDITTFLGAQDPNLTFLTLTSRLNPEANGKYQILKKHLIGHYEGSEWYVQYHCSARNTGGEK